VKILERFLEEDLLGFRFALNVCIGTAALWIALPLIVRYQMLSR
jgi:hypothetical protein